MKKLIVFMVFFFIFLCLLLQLSFAASQAQAIARVTLTIKRSISVETSDARTDSETNDTGELFMPLAVKVASGAQDVAMSAVVTDLHKADGLSYGEDNSIPVDLSRGVAMRRQSEGTDDRVSGYIGTETLSTEEGSFKGHLTEELITDDAESSGFNRKMEIVPVWKDPDSQKPQGEYSGYVLVHACVVDDLGLQM